jgi:L-ascorbate metabolism protein UlaG (beta-lactamase superfamily)
MRVRTPPARSGSRERAPAVCSRDVIPDDATFRRAEGLWFQIAPCSGRIGVRCRRQDGETRTELTRDQLRRVSRLRRWQTAGEVAATPSELRDLVERNCVFWSAGRPDRDLGAEPLDVLDGAIALRGNVAAVPLMVDAGGALRALPFMPRRGDVDGLELGGVRFQVFEWDTEVTTAVIACCAAHARALRDLVPRLDGRSTVAELVADDRTRPLVVALDDLGLLTRPPPPPRPAGAARVTWLAHAGVLYEASGRRVLIDPVVFDRSIPTRQPIEPVDARTLGDVDAVLITHGDNDHFNPKTLLRLRRSTPIYVPRAASPQPYHVDLGRVLALLGFSRVVELDDWQRIELAPLTIVAAPFRGEDWGLPLPARTYVIDGPDLTIYANADSTTDADACARIAREFAIDLAFVGVTGAAEAHAMPKGYGYGGFYVEWIPAERHNEWIELCNGPRGAADVARRVGARYAFGYAAGGAAFCPVAYCDRGSHAELAALLDADRGGPRPLALEIGVPREVPG